MTKLTQCQKHDMTFAYHDEHCKQPRPAAAAHNQCFIKSV